jgi:hypothetical protein
MPCKGSNSFSSASVIEENMSSHMDKFASHKIESVFETTCSVKTDERIVSAMTHLN